MRVTCRLLPFRPNGDRVPVSYMLHRWGICQFVAGPGGLVLGILAARAGDWWVSVPSLVVGACASAVSALMIKGLWVLRNRRRAGGAGRGRRG
ncbi:hypothetical protein H3146_22650 [Streptomyces sp. OF3]|uniref:Uncharacterized protein n=1 Tax=Streptomyces alkaliterrae TaxID=2213162 RepID=A0A7W3ZPY5_9ACTN|nr:hypothetical protein [Streptomyces alkaliterrae]MBB1256136.1 hypothetical protein [Streptomyces alkaliterrae]